MHTIQIKKPTDADGVLHLTVPLGRPDTEYEVILVVQPKSQQRDDGSTPEERGWPPGYFENVPGSITDETFRRHPQGELPPPVEFE